MKTKKVLLILPVLLIASLACSVFGIDLQGGGVNFDIRISESQLNTGDLSINIGELFTGNYNVDLQPGVMVLSGVLVRPNGTETRGQAEVGIRANNGALEVEILAVDADGIDINDSRAQNPPAQPRRKPQPGVRGAGFRIDRIGRGHRPGDRHHRARLAGRGGGQ